MADALPDLDVTDAELAVLQTLWEHGPSPIRRLADILYPGGKTAEYGTVQQLLVRLERKGCVRRDRSPWPHVFAAAVTRDMIIGHRLRATAEQLCGGSMTPLLLHLLRAEKFNASESRELRGFLERLRRDQESISQKGSS
jgi:predicted transcriptional regulator